LSKARTHAHNSLRYSQNPSEWANWCKSIPYFVNKCTDPERKCEYKRRQDLSPSPMVTIQTLKDLNR
jgi:hypothetical protein